jgi:hypothetical protein
MYVLPEALTSANAPVVKKCLLTLLLAIPKYATDGLDAVKAKDESLIFRCIAFRHLNLADPCGIQANHLLRFFF